MDRSPVKSESVTSTEERRKSNLGNIAKNLIKSPYNKVDINDIDFHPKPKKKRIKGLPTEKNINLFLRQLTFNKLSKLSAKFVDKVSSLKNNIAYNAYKKIINETFNPPPEESLRDLLYKRFRPLKFTDDGRELDIEGQEMCVIDLMLALALLSRAISKYSDKLRLIFNF
jgi:hypothetical protein